MNRRPFVHQLTELVTDPPSDSDVVVALSLPGRWLQFRVQASPGPETLARSEPTKAHEKAQSLLAQLTEMTPQTVSVSRFSTALRRWTRPTRTSTISVDVVPKSRILRCYRPLRAHRSWTYLLLVTHFCTIWKTSPHPLHMRNPKCKLKLPKLPLSLLWTCLSLIQPS